MTLEAHVKEFKQQGFTVFSNFRSPEWVDEVRAVMDFEFDKLFEDDPLVRRKKIVPLLGHEVLGPMLKNHALDPLMLDFAEMVMGPFVQSDSYEVSGFPIRDASEKGDPDRWHRDAFHTAAQWANPYKSQGRLHEHKPYTPPLACNCLTYLQDMNAETGPFRMVPGSHLDFTVIPKEQENEQHPRQIFLELKAGDMVFLHHDVLHTGTWNISDQYRYFISNFVCRIGLPHRDTFDLPVIHEIMEEARAKNDRRALRFFGEDDRFVEREEESWKRMVEEDKAALKS